MLTFNQSPVGTTSLASVSQSLGWKQYHRFRPRAGMTIQQDPGCLDLAAYEPHNRRFRSFHEFRVTPDLCYDFQKIPVAVMGYKNEQDKKATVAHAKQSGTKCSANTGYSFFGGVTFGSLMRAYSSVDPKEMWLCAMVADNAPVHMYFDFDASTTAASTPSAQQKAAQELGSRVQGQEAFVKLEFMQMFSAFFEQVYHRQPNWTGLHWETASDLEIGKFSLHAHLITEAFVDIKHMGRFMKGFAEFLVQQSTEGKVQWLLHADTDSNASLLDTSVYTPNRVFRLIGCRKPGKTQLIPLPSTPEEASLSLEELVFRGMPSLSIGVDDAHLLEFQCKQPPSQKRKAPGPTLLKAAAKNAAAVTVGSDESSDAVRAVLEAACIGLFELGPCVKVQRCQTIRMTASSKGLAGLFDGSNMIDRRYEGEFVLGSAWCPHMTKIDASTLSAVPHMHKNTAIAFSITMQWITIMDFRCGTERKKRFAPDLERANVSVQQWRSIFCAWPSRSADAQPDSETSLLPGSNPGPAAAAAAADAERSVVQDPAGPMIIDTLDPFMISESSNSDSGAHAVSDFTPTSTASTGSAGDTVANVHTAADEMQPSLESIRRIIAQHSERHLTTQRELTLKVRLATSQGDANAVALCEEAAAATEAALLLEIVQYCNRFWGKFMRLGKPWMVQELGTAQDAKVDAPTRKNAAVFTSTFNSLKHLEELYSDLNVLLPSLLPSQRRGVPKRSSQPAQSNIAALWLVHPASRKLNGIEFNPQRNATAFRDARHTTELCDYNLWRGFAVTDEAATAYAREAVGSLAAACDMRMLAIAQPILDHILNVWCKKDQRSFDYVMGWMANIVQKRGKNGTALVVKGPQGAGKGVIVQKLGNVIGRDHFFHAHNIEDVLGTYTHNIRASCLVFLDEVTYGGNHEQAQRCKKLVTEPTHINNAKFQPSFTVDSYVNVIIASNSEFVVPCEAQQRRFFALEVDDSHSGRQDDRLKAYYDAILNVPTEAFAYVLYKYNLSGFNPRQIHSTDFERDQKIRSFTPMMAWWHDCLQENDIENVRMAQRGGGGDDNDQVVENAAPGASVFGLLVVKDSIYDSFTSFCVRNRKGNTYQVTAKNEFWKLLDLWTQTPERIRLGTRLTLPERKREIEHMGQLQWVRVVTMPSLIECRRAFKTAVVRDEDWKFKSDDPI